jgi:predicted patatin/cPLA2 family phospholipase
MDALVISGGGSKGAFAGGVADFLMNYCGKEYKTFVGTSAGSLLAPLLALGKIDKLKEVFTSVQNKDVFSTNPFIVRKINGIFHTRINHFNTLRMFLMGRKTFGETKNLRKLIARTFTKSDYNLLRASHKEVIVTVTNLTSGLVEYKSVHGCSYDDFCDWMWASSNVVPFMSLVTKNGMEYADGGFGNYLPVKAAIERGAREIDAIVLRPQNLTVKNMPSENPFGVLLKTFDFMLNQIGNDDILITNLQSRVRRTTVNCYFTPRVLTENSFIFEPEQMSGWWKEGFEYAKSQSPSCYQFE